MRIRPAAAKPLSTARKQKNQTVSSGLASSQVIDDSENITTASAKVFCFSIFCDRRRQNGIVNIWAMVLAIRNSTIQSPGFSLPSTNFIKKKIIAVEVNRPKSCTNLTPSSAMKGLFAIAVFSCSRNDTFLTSRVRIGPLAVPKNAHAMKMKISRP